MKKLLSVILVLTMLFSTVAFAVPSMVSGVETSEEEISNTEISAVDAITYSAISLSGDGTEETPYLINNLGDLKAFRDDVNAGNTYEGEYVALTADIDLTGVVWTPIGSSGYDKAPTADNTKMFAGNFDGGNYTITGLSSDGYVPAVEDIADGVEYGFGLFGYVYGANISNVKLADVDIECVNRTDSDGNAVEGAGVAALVGFYMPKDGATSVVDNCHLLSGTVKATNNMGGLIGFMGAQITMPEIDITIKNCTNAADITTEKREAGGILGLFNGSRTSDKYLSIDGTLTFENCVNTGDITSLGLGGHSAAGGIVGCDRNEDSWQHAMLIYDGCKNEGTIKVKASGETHIGGLGACYYAIQGTRTLVKNSQNTGAVVVENPDNASDVYAGGLVSFGGIVEIDGSKNTGSVTVGGEKGNKYIGAVAKILFLNDMDDFSDVVGGSTYFLNGGVAPALSDMHDGSGNYGYYPVKNASKEGFDFGGWYDNADFTGKLYGESESIRNIGNLVFYAKWDGPVAKIGDEEFSSIDEAIEYANTLAGNVTIEIFDKVEYSNATPNLTGAYDSITFVGKTDNAEISITRNGSNGYISGEHNDCAVNFEALTLSKPQGYFADDAGFMNLAFSVYRVGSVNYTDCYFANGSAAAGCPTTYTGCTFKRSNDKYGLWAYGSGNIVVDNCIFDDYRGIKLYDENKGANNTTVITVKNSDFSAVYDKPAFVVTYAKSITLENNKYPDSGVFELDMDGKPDGTLVTADDYSEIICVNDDGDCGVLVDGKIYTSLSDAIDAGAVKNDGTSEVTLFYASDEEIELPFGTTLNTNDYETAITVNGGNVLGNSQINMDNPEKTFISAEITNVNATESVVIKLFTAEDELVSTTTLLKPEYFNRSVLSVSICTTGSSSSWETVWEGGCAKEELQPSYSVLYIDDVEASRANVPMIKTSGETPVNWVDVPGVKALPKGSNSPAYVKEVDGYVRVWGEGYGNALESYELKLYSDETLVATTKLNNVGGIIDGDVTVTWNFFYPASSDDYWTTTWELGMPSSHYEPTHVDLIVDGTVVATTPAQMNAPDDLNPVSWADMTGVKSSLEGEGTETNPYLITCLEDLIWFRDTANTYKSDGSNQFRGKYVKLMDDIDLEGINWEPIGRNAQGDHMGFIGHFDGNGKTISNLYVNTSGQYIGLFAMTGDGGDGTAASIKNLTINNATVISSNNSNYVGIVTGNSRATTTIDNVHIKGNIEVSGRGYIGGIIGHGYPTIKNSSVEATGTITSSFWCAGGMVGYGGEGSTNIIDSKVIGTGEEGIVIMSAAGGLGAFVGMAEDNYNTQPISGSNLTAKNVHLGTYTGAYGDSYANYALGYLYGGSEITKFTGVNTIENVTITCSNGETPTAVDAIATVEDVTYFNLNDAVAAAQPGDTVTLLRDYTGTVNFAAAPADEAQLLAEDDAVIFDLNNKTITGNIVIDDGVTVEIKNGTIDCPNTVDTINSFGNLTLTDVTVDGERHVVRAKKGTLTINSGTYKYTGSAPDQTRNVINIGDDENPEVNKVTAVINGGTFIGPNGYNVESGAALVVQKGSSATINGGNFSGGKTYTMRADNGAEINVYSGTVIGTINGSVTVHGGIYSENPTAYLAANTIAYKMPNGYWGIAAARTIKLVPEEAADTTVKTNEEFTLEVYIDGVDAKGAKWDLSFVDTYFEYVSMTTDYSNMNGGTLAPEIICQTGTIDTTKPVATYTFKSKTQAVEKSPFEFTSADIRTVENAWEGIDVTDTITAYMTVVTVELREITTKVYNNGAELSEDFITENHDANTSYTITVKGFEDVDGTETELTTATVTYKLNGEDVTAAELENLSDVGVYVIDYTVSMEGYEDETGTFTLTINYNQYDVKAFFGEEELTGTEKEIFYDGGEHIFEVIASPADPDVTKITYKVNGVETTTPPVIKDVDKYVIEYTVEGSPSYGYETVTGKVTITVNTPIFEVEVAHGFGEDSDYVDGTKLVLVYTDAENVSFDFDGVKMLDVSNKPEECRYLFNDITPYEHVYALVVDASLYAGNLDAYRAKVTLDYDTAAPEVKYDLVNDINFSTSVTWDDIMAAYSVVENNEYAFTHQMAGFIKADTNGDKKATSQDATPIIAEVYGN